MKIRTAHIVIAVIFILVALIVYASASVLSRTKAPVTPDADFLTEVHARAAANTGTEADGSQLPVVENEGPEPAIEIQPEKELDLGTIANDKPATGEITVFNKGEGNLVINRINSSCGCTKGTIPEDMKTIPPGRSAPITVTVDPLHVGGFDARKTLMIFSNDKNHQQVDIDVIAKVDPEYAIEPEKVDLGSVRKGTPAGANLVFRQLSDAPIDLIEVKATSTSKEDFDVSYEKRPEGEWAKPNHTEYAIRVNLSDEVSPGLLTSRLLIKTSCKRVPTHRMEVKGEVVSFYRIEPKKDIMLRPSVKLKPREATPPTDATSAEAILQDKLREESEQPMKYFVKIIGERPFEILNLRTTNEALTASSTTGDTPNTVVIEVVAQPDIISKSESEFVKFSLKSGDETVNDSIPVRYWGGFGRPDRKPFLKSGKNAKKPQETPPGT